MKRIIAENRPLLIGYDENRFAERLHYAAMDSQAAVQAYSIVRRMTADLLRRLAPADFERCGIHSETGKVTLAEMIEKYIGHVNHHLKFLYDKRSKLGKPVEARYA